ncbi:MAG: hypothetical protein ACJAV6_000227 [Candidatus Paceibacteria bacterium]|jgi:hypothetical protein
MQISELAAFLEQYKDMYSKLPKGTLLLKVMDYLIL